MFRDKGYGRRRGCANNGGYCGRTDWNLVEPGENKQINGQLLVQGSIRACGQLNAAGIFFCESAEATGLAMICVWEFRNADHQNLR